MTTHVRCPIYAIFNDQSFIDTLTNNIVSFEQLGPGLKKAEFSDFTICIGNNLMYSEILMKI